MKVLIQQVGCFQHCRPAHWEAAPGAPCPKRLHFLVWMHSGKQDWWPSVETMLKYRFCNTHQEKKLKRWRICKSYFHCFPLIKHHYLPHRHLHLFLFLQKEATMKELNITGWILCSKRNSTALYLSLECVLEWKAWHNPTWELKIPQSLLNTSKF